mmetsp:Transcript_44581/g.72569  ORF Transcript_44581/g.72569 Transcript_44581/m.72569 type:complete len:537 (+) Transcript_44581:43-1653(+)|eukprot:CAMPEP_0184333678 /NCGR_PEP_ID=MMETSP1089-20130417/2625_1 /TAXON_ID=38269 ORGANISM="Gloeochaete wittrockiana, Strain SAG46.84" /NCGR_SAMPLE_ID=MMETSP1089 /ASSEMBLY_ACC=CAM_ASM_000445 /LENGTH=536 /DNA_ID=CAMNT_0026657603 /DNA_START=35 /DNA_END=1645 /DNA_ORIENTATION=+
MYYDEQEREADTGYRKDGDFRDRETFGDGYDQQEQMAYAQQDYHVPSEVKDFVVIFYRAYQDRNVPALLQIYEEAFSRLTEKFYKSSPWPHSDSFAHIVPADPVFISLYNELYFRHLYSKTQPMIAQRFESWNNYFDIMSALINSPTLPFDLPAQWLWDIIDEYIYQFQAFCQFKAKLKQRTDEDIQLLKDNEQVWNVNTVISSLQELVKRSNITEVLERERKEGLDPKDCDSVTAQYRMLGYFSLIGLLRVQTLLGDYYLALKAVDFIDLNNQTGTFSASVIACHISFYYYIGFSYLMMRRYVDAVKNFQTALLYIGRTKQYHTKSTYQYDQILKKADQMYALLAIAVSLNPQRVDDQVSTVLREKYSEKMARLQRGDLEAFQELFANACPKFISPVPPNYADINNCTPQAAFMHQSSMFLKDVQQQTVLPTLRSYLKLYTTISMPKLVNFLKMEANNSTEDDLRTNLLCLKHKSRQLTWVSGTPLDGAWTASSDVDFFVDLDMIHVIEDKSQRQHSDYFVSQILRFNELMDSLH